MDALKEKIKLKIKEYNSAQPELKMPILKDLSGLNADLGAALRKASLSKAAISLSEMGNSQNLNEADQVVFEKMLKELTMALKLSNGVECNDSVANGLMDAVKSKHQRKKEACYESSVVVDKVEALAESLGALEGQESKSL